MSTVANQMLEISQQTQISATQERLWFLQELEPDSSVYHTSAAFRLTGKLSAELLERRLNQIVAQQTPLRATFKAIDGQPQQQIAPNAAITIAVEDVADEHAAAKRA